MDTQEYLFTSLDSLPGPLAVLLPASTCFAGNEGRLSLDTSTSSLSRPFVSLCLLPDLHFPRKGMREKKVSKCFDFKGFVFRSSLV